MTVIPPTHILIERAVSRPVVSLIAGYAIGRWAVGGQIAAYVALYWAVDYWLTRIRERKR